MLQKRCFQQVEDEGEGNYLCQGLHPLRKKDQTLLHVNKTSDRQQIKVCETHGRRKKKD